MLKAKRTKRNISFVTLSLALVMIMTISISAFELQRYAVDPIAIALSSLKDSVSGVTSSNLAVSCTGELEYYGYTGYSTSTTAAVTCNNVYAKVAVYDDDLGWWVVVDTDDVSYTTSAYAADQYGDGTEPSRGYHYIKDNNNGTWGSKTSYLTSFSY